MKGINTQYTDDVVCPYCGYESSDSWEYLKDRRSYKVITCADCEKQFSLTITYIATYSTERNCELNGEEHLLDVEPDIFNDDYFYYHCKKCDYHTVKQKEREQSAVSTV